MTHSPTQSLSIDLVPPDFFRTSQSTTMSNWMVDSKKEIVQKIQEFVHGAREDRNNIFFCDLRKYHSGCTILIQSPPEFNGAMETMTIQCNLTQRLVDRPDERRAPIIREIYSNARLGKDFCAEAILPFEYGEAVKFMGKIGNAIEEKKSCTIL